YVGVADNAAGFAQKIREALESPPNPAHLRQRVERETWSAKAEAVVTHLEQGGVRFRASTATEEAEAGAAPAEAVAAASGEDGSRKPRLVETGQGTGARYWRNRHLIGAGLLALIGV